MRLLLLVVLAFLVRGALANVDSLAPGTDLGAENGEEARGLLPDEFLEAHHRGDFRHGLGGDRFEA